MVFTYKNDPLLFKEKDAKNFVNINSLNDKNLLVLPGGILNLYSALVKSLDFENLHFNSLPYCKVDNKVIEKYLNEEFIKKDYLKLRKLLATYCNKKKIKIENIRKWKKVNVWPLVILRVISRLHKNELKCLSDLLAETNGFYNLSKNTYIKFPLRLKELLNEKHAYLVGAILGDGGFCLTNYWTIVDGGKPSELRYSYEYLNKIKNLFVNLYKIDHLKLRQRENKIELIISRKEFGRFLNFFFGVPYGKKKNRIQKPSIFENSKKKDKLYDLFWRGMFDTDGYCDRKWNHISFCSYTPKLIEECLKDLNGFSICQNKIQKNNSAIYLKSENYDIFANRVGFSHPRKKKYLLNQLSKGSNETKLIGINDKNTFEDFFDLIKIPNLRIYNANSKYSNCKNRFIFRNIINWEKKGGIPFNKLYESWTLKGGSLKELYKWLHKNKDLIRYGLNGRGKLSNLVKLPLIVDETILDLAKSIRPYKYEVRIRKGGNNPYFIQKFETLFDSKIVETRASVKSNLSKVILTYFKTFFIYGKNWEPYSIKKLKRLDAKLESIWI